MIVNLNSTGSVLCQPQEWQGTSPWPGQKDFDNYEEGADDTASVSNDQNFRCYKGESPLDKPVREIVDHLTKKIPDAKIRSSHFGDYYMIEIDSPEHIYYGNVLNDVTDYLKTYYPDIKYGLSDGGKCRSSNWLRFGIFYIPEGSKTKSFQYPSYQLDPSCISEINNLVSENGLYEHISTLENFGARFVGSDGNSNAENYIYAYLVDLGLDVNLQAFYTDNESYAWENVAATKEGVGESKNDIYIISAHFDSRYNGVDDIAAAADDNGSGVAAVLEVARILSCYQFNSTIVFCFFNGEEIGLAGSAYYASWARSQGLNIKGVINLDMVGRPDELYKIGEKIEDLEVIANSSSTGLIKFLTSLKAGDKTGLPIKLEINDRADHADHGMFWNYGFPAVCLTTDYPPGTHGGKLNQDNIQDINFLYLADVTRATAISLAGLAKPAY